MDNRYLLAFFRALVYASLTAALIVIGVFLLATEHDSPRQKKTYKMETPAALRYWDVDSRMWRIHTCPGKRVLVKDVD